MDSVVLVAFGGFLSAVAIAFVVLVHFNFKEALYHAMNSYSQSIHAHDDASVRIADHRRLDNERLATLTQYAETMAKVNAELSQFVLAHKTVPSQAPHINPTTVVRRPPPASPPSSIEAQERL